MTVQDLLYRKAWRGTLLTAVVTAVGMLVSVAMHRSIEGSQLWPPLLSCAIGFLSIGFLVLARQRVSINVCAIVYLLNSASVIAAFQFANLEGAMLSLREVPFQGDKLGVFVAAALSPTIGTGMISIAAHVLLPVWEYLHYPEIQTHVGAEGPWAVVAFGVVASVILVSRFSRHKLELELAVAQSERAAVLEAARKFQSIRDLMNTPLQTISLALSLSRETRVFDEKVLGEMERSVDALTKVNETLAKYDIKGVRPTDGSLSFDAMKILSKPGFKG